MTLQQDIISVAQFVDFSYIREQYPDLTGTDGDLLVHFVTKGWYEGRNPSPHFDIVQYLIDYPDVERSGVNPLLHYLHYGRQEGRTAAPSVAPKARTMLYLHTAIANWVEIIRPHVDETFYRRVLPNNIPDTIDVAAHFAFRGWRQGFSPSKSLQTQTLLTLYPEASRLLINPVIPFALGYKEPRDTTAQSFTSHQDNSDDLDIVTLFANATPDSISTHFDPTFYLNNYPDIRESGIDPISHYFWTGWREGRDPSPSFSTSEYFLDNRDFVDKEVNPLFHYVIWGQKNNAIVKTSCVKSGIASSSDDSIIQAISADFDIDYYTSMYPDVHHSAIDPIRHYHTQGWREGRNPNDEFETSYYIATNDDVRSAGCNPFWHYIVAGKSEGRIASRLGGAKRVAFSQARSAREHSSSWPENRLEPISASGLLSILTEQLAIKRCFILSMSHDLYTRNIGGTQIFVNDECNFFKSIDCIYINVSPTLPRLYIGSDVSTLEVNIIIDGEEIGSISLTSLIEILTLCRKINNNFWLIIHSLLGFSDHYFVELKRVVDAGRCIFWAHDYFSICEGLNLLRNDIEYCRVPASNSISCRVCVHGDTRRHHLQVVRNFFDVLSPTVIFPSDAARRIIKPHLPQKLPQFVFPHWALTSPHTISNIRPDRTVRVAFIGHPATVKGWPGFVHLVKQLQHVQNLEFFHFGSRRHWAGSGVRFIETRVTHQNRFDAIDKLKNNEIDYVLMLSPWPETFSFVTFEALSAGCRVVCLKSSGNVARAVREFGLGRVFRDIDDIQRFLENVKPPKFRTFFTVETIGTTGRFLLQKELLT